MVNQAILPRNYDKNCINSLMHVPWFGWFWTGIWPWFGWFWTGTWPWFGWVWTWFLAEKSHIEQWISAPAITRYWGLINLTSHTFGYANIRAKLHQIRQFCVMLCRLSAPLNCELNIQLRVINKVFRFSQHCV